jgi:glycosyltransferase involved in cell wall biosynthesis
MPDLPDLPPIASAPLSVVLLARDDAAHLEAITAGWTTFLNGLGREIELILIDDCSRDGSLELLSAMAERHPRLQILRNELPLGEGRALARGLTAACHPLVFYCRCEPRYQTGDLRKLLREIDKVHIVSGFRSGRQAPAIVRLAGMLYRGFCRVVFSHAPTPSPGWLGWKRLFGRWCARLFFGVHSRDITCPYRLLRREILARIPLQSRGCFVHVELLAKANFLGHLIGEEIPLGDRQDSVFPEELRHERLRDVLADARLVFSHPDFGPTHLPGPASAATVVEATVQDTKSPVSPSP